MLMYLIKYGAFELKSSTLNSYTDYHKAPARALIPVMYIYCMCVRDFSAFIHILGSSKHTTDFSVEMLEKLITTLLSMFRQFIYMSWIQGKLKLCIIIKQYCSSVFL